MATIEKIFTNKTLTVYPEILSSRLQDVIKGHCKFIFADDAYRYKDHIFKLPTNPRPETVLIHSSCGGGNGYILFKDLQFTQPVKDLCTQRYKLLAKPYLCIQIRHTDYKCNYADLYNTHKDMFQAYKSIYVATDNPDVLEFFAKQDVRVYNYTTFSNEPNARNLHRSSVCAHTKLTDMIADLYLCVNADQFLSNSTGGYINLIQQCRTYKTATAQQFA